MVPFSIYTECSECEDALKRYSLNCYVSSIDDSRSLKEGSMPRYVGKQSAYVKGHKIAFWILWTSYGDRAVSLLGIPIPFVPKLYLIALALVASFLSRISYCLCCIYARFLDAFSIIEGLEDYDRNYQAPLYTPEYEKLNREAAGHLHIFLTMSL